MNDQPRIVLVPDRDYLAGIKMHNYPEFEDELSRSDGVTVTKETARLEYGIPDPEENKIYIRNIYNGTYHDLTSDRLQADFIIAKSIAIREVLIMLGVYSAEIVESAKKAEDKKTNIKANGASKQYAANVNLDVKIEKEVRASVESTIKIGPYERTPKTANEIETYMRTHGLGDEASLKGWVERLKRDGKLEGPESTTIVFLSELKGTTDSVLGLQLVKAEANFHVGTLKTVDHTFEKKLSVNFSKPL